MFRLTSNQRNTNVVIGQKSQRLREYSSRRKRSKSKVNFQLFEKAYIFELRPDKIDEDRKLDESFGT